MTPTAPPRWCATWPAGGGGPPRPPAPRPPPSWAIGSARAGPCWARFRAERRAGGAPASARAGPCRAFDRAERRAGGSWGGPRRNSASAAWPSGAFSAPPPAPSRAPASAHAGPCRAL
eukprot:791907-Alexandrium_andersonii.AAC.1